MRGRSRHHILHAQQEWTLRPEAAYLRGQPTLIPLIENDIHELTHRLSPAVPLLGFYALRQVANDFKPGADTLESLDNLRFSIYLAGEHPRAHAIERDLAALAIETLTLQHEILRGNIIKGN